MMFMNLSSSNNCVFWFWFWWSLYRILLSWLNFSSLYFRYTYNIFVYIYIYMYMYMYVQKTCFSFNNIFLSNCFYLYNIYSVYQVPVYYKYTHTHIHISYSWFIYSICWLIFVLNSILSIINAQTLLSLDHIIIIIIIIIINF